MKLFVATLFTLLALGVCKFEHVDDLPTAKGCPSFIDISPCRCYHYTDVGYGLDCSDVTSERQLTKIFEADFPNKTFHELIIEGERGRPVNIEALTPGNLGDVTFRKIFISETKLHSIKPNAFMNSYKTLEHLTVSRSPLSVFNASELAHFEALYYLSIANIGMSLLPQLSAPYLRTLDVSGNPIGEIKVDAFSNTPSLKRLVLENISLTSLAPKTFSSLSLEVLDLQNNQLKELPTKSLAMASSSLITLRLENNKLQTVESGAIQGLASNAHLSLYRTGLKQLPESVWRPVFEQLSHPDAVVILEDNPLECGCDVLWLLSSEPFMKRLGSISGGAEALCSDGAPLSSLTPKRVCPNAYQK